MANKKITQLTAALDVKDGDLLVIVDMTEGQTEKITKLQFERALRLGELQGTTDDIDEGTSNLYWTTARFDNRFAQKTTDDLNQGLINKYLTLANLLALLAQGNITTDHIPEGSSNLYWTNLRFDTRFGQKTTDQLAEGSNNLYYTTSRWDARFATKTADDMIEGVTNKFFTTARFNVAFSQKTTDSLAEGLNNLYYTDARTDARINLQKGQPNGLATLDATGKIPATQLSKIYTSEVYTVPDNAARDQLLISPGLQSGDIVNVTNAATTGMNMTYIYDGANFIELKSHDSVSSVNGFIGDVVLNTDHISEGLTNKYWTQQRFDDRFAQKHTDNLQEGLGNLYFTNERVRLALNTFSINELLDVDMVNNPPVPNYFLAWSGTRWVPRQPQAFSDTKDVLASPTDLHAGFLNQKVVGTAGKITVGLLNNVGQIGNEQIQIGLGADVFDIQDHTTDDITEGSNNLYYTQTRFDTALAAKTTDDLAEGLTNLYHTNARVDARIDLQKAQPNGLATLDANGKVLANQIPQIVLCDVYVVNTIAERDALPDLGEGDIAKVLDNGSGTAETFIYDGTGWISLNTGGVVDSVNGQTGHVVLTTTNVNEGANLYYTQARFDSAFTAKSTDDLTEGATNLYYTAERARDLIAGLIQNGAGISWVYDDLNDTLIPTVSLAGFSTSDLAEGSNLYWTQARFNAALASKTTTDVTEGTNLYYTDERVRDAVATFIQNGTGITWTHDDPNNTLTATISLASFSTTNLAEGTNLYWTQARFNAAFVAKTTTDLAEGTNLYYTNARAISAIGGSKNDSGTGTSDLWSASKIISYTSTNHYLKSEHLSARVGPASAAQPIITNAFGFVDPSFIPSFQIVGAFEAAAVNVVSTTSTTFATMPDMALTPPSGSYLVIFNSDLKLSANNALCQLRITIDGTTIAADSLRFWGQSNSTNRDSLVTFAIITVNGTQQVRGEWRVDPGSAVATLTSEARSIKLIKVALP